MRPSVTTGKCRVGTLSRSGIIAVEALPDHERHERLLRVEAVLRLVPDGRARAVEHVLGDLLAVVGGQAVQDDGPLARESDRALVDSVGGQVGEAALPLLVLAHARPDVGVEDVRARGRRARLGGQRDRAPRRLGGSTGPADDLLRGLVPGRRRRHEVRAELGAGDHERVADVVPVAEVGDPDAFEGPESLPDRHDVGERLAGVELVRQPVDHRHVRVLGELVHVGLSERADHDPVEVAREDRGCVLDRLPAPELEVAGREVEAGAAELGDADLEAHARARRGLLKDHPERPSLEVPVGDALALACLQAVGQVERLGELVRRPVVDPEEVPALEPRGNHGRILTSVQLAIRALRFYTGQRSRPKGGLRMTLVRWEPFRELAALQNEMSRWMSPPTGTTPGNGSASTWLPAVDVWETDDELVVSFDLPGIREDEI